MQNLLQLRPATDLRLVLEMEQWLAVAEEIRRGRCNVQRLTLAMLQTTRSETTEAFKAVASAIRLDRNLKYLMLQMENGFTDEAGLVLAEALTVNKTLYKIKLTAEPVFGDEALPNTDELGIPAYEAFSAMMRGNTSLKLKFPSFESTGADDRLIDSHTQMRIEQILNDVGRGGLLTSSNHTTREQWVDALHDLNSSNVKDSLAFQVSCLYSLLRLNPSVVCMSQTS
jgi:hypothetical protein